MVGMSCYSFFFKKNITCAFSNTNFLILLPVKPSLNFVKQNFLRRNTPESLSCMLPGFCKVRNQVAVCSPGILEHNFKNNLSYPKEVPLKS